MKFNVNIILSTFIVGSCAVSLPPPSDLEARSYIGIECGGVSLDSDTMADFDLS